MVREMCQFAVYAIKVFCSRHDLKQIVHANTPSWGGRGTGFARCMHASDHLEWVFFVWAPINDPRYFPLYAYAKTVCDDHLESAQRFLFASPVAKFPASNVTIF
jgi:hypothetical protein